MERLKLQEAGSLAQWSRENVAQVSVVNWPAFSKDIIIFAQVLPMQCLAAEAVQYFTEPMGRYGETSPTLSLAFGLGTLM